MDVARIISWTFGLVIRDQTDLASEFSDGNIQSVHRAQ